MTDELLQLADWLRAGQVEAVAMESTGVYWKPVFNILESEFEVILVNARHIKYVPGRKSDISDAQWIGELLQHGLLKASYIPEQPQRDLRDLLRYRTALIQERVREVNRVQKVLEDANVKLASVASNVMGVSGRKMLAAIIAGKDDPKVLAEMSKGRLRAKIPELERALQGRVRNSHRILLHLHLEHIDDLSSKIDRLNEEIDQHMRPFDEEEQLRRLDEIPGIGRDVAQIILAELGNDMSRFPSSAHAASWSGLAPGKNESAGKNRSGKITPGNKHLKSALVQAAHAASRTKDNYLAAQFRRLAARRGKKRAAIAVAHSMLVIVYHMLRDGTEYQDLGGDYFDKRNKDKLQRHLVKRLERLGLQVSLQSAVVAN
jgi:transposase